MAGSVGMDRHESTGQCIFLWQKQGKEYKKVNLTRHPDNGIVAVEARKGEVKSW